MISPNELAVVQSDPRKDGTAIMNQGPCSQNIHVVDNGGTKANPTAACKKAVKAHLTPTDCACLIHAGTILDHH